MSKKTLYYKIKKYLLISFLSLGLYASDLELTNSDNFINETDENTIEDRLLTIAKFSNRRVNDANNVNSQNLNSEVNNNKTINMEDLMLDEEESNERLKQENEEKIQIICERDSMTIEEFNEFACICMKEAKPFSGEQEDYDSVYIDSYAVANTFYNRTRSIKWRDYINSLNTGAGENVYGQITAAGQSTVYIEGTYESILNEDKTGHPAYQAVIDMLYSEICMHNYLNFKSDGSNPNGKEQFVSGGNRFHGELETEDIYISEESLALSLTQNY